MELLKRAREVLEFWNWFSPKLEKRAPFHRRWLGIALFFGCVIFSGTYRKLTWWLTDGYHKLPHWLPDPSWKGAWHYFLDGGTLWFQLIGWAVYSYVFCVLLTLFIKTVKPPEWKADKYKALIAYLVDKLGIVQFYSTRTEQPVEQQDYAADMRIAVLSTRRLRLLSIAGYEYLGKEKDSLLYHALNCRPEIDVEIILLNPQLGMPVLHQRAAELAGRVPPVPVSEIISHIQKTIVAVKALNKLRSNKIKLYLCEWHPIFRLLVCDDMMFMSCYGKLVHGHETPVLKIDRQPPDKSGADTMYHSFENYFNSLKTNCATVDA